MIKLAFINSTVLKNKKNNPRGVVNPPVYPGGKQALNDFIKSHLQYPEEALRNKIQGTVSIDYDIDVFGEVTAAKIKHGIGYGCDEEALRLVRQLKFAKRKYQGLHVVFHQNININFHLHPTAPPPSQEQTIRYDFKEEKKSDGSSSYTIQIKLP